MDIVLDANILVRATLGRKVEPLIERYRLDVSFYVTDSALTEARDHIAEIASKRGVGPEKLSSELESVVDDLAVIERSRYESQLGRAEGRLGARDIDDAPTLAVSLLLGCPIWTEDQDFFGCGAATWTSDRVEIYLSGDPSL